MRCSHLFGSSMRKLTPLPRRTECSPSEMHLLCPVVPASATGGGSSAGSVCAAAAKHPPSISVATATHLALVMEFPLRKSPSPLVARWPVKVQADAVPALPARRPCLDRTVSHL